uniref:NADH-ubiquinone oxidoreductase chain 4 n=2 Tax=Chionoecetes TaxID=41209 RepID=A0A6M4SSF9_CHIOP|nr:NADH dehydrogenase subunit 4 [Chionoecetes opilio x Chionoecetes japonicus]QJS52757.1 NADH dehydrogenase subunit 4 [Chionoecetes opilio]UWV18217.1 NADH dehydrogenase subunit 4 [Chionoecetes opilio x Chionoecetes japonicus]WAI96440.1 NADH dehydrogenase subunit 4 [Chionoecetes opilio x Chionoecetes japonicus]
MLKLILPLVMLMKYMKVCSVVQIGLLIVSFMVGLMSYHDFYFYGIGFSLGIDSVSYIMILLSVWIMSLVLMASQKVKYSKNFYGSFIGVNLLLLICLLITFSSMEYMLFYISFEMSLIPTLILILGWGYQPERIQAGIYMLFYTLLFSLPLLGSLLLALNKSGSLVILLSQPFIYDSYLMMIWYFATVMAFVVKLPMYMLHLWLPKAHVEAPVAGSMILAGVLLKLGGYGLIRVLILFQFMGKESYWVWLSLGLVGGSLVSLMCLRQVDMKALIAYSSVAHMSLVLCGIMGFSWWGLSGAVVVMVGHGLCSSGLFCLANIVYERLGSRSLLMSKGLLSFMPSMGLWWFLLSVSNMASPPSLNLLGEINLIISVVSWSKLTMFGLVSLSFLSASYTLYMYSLTQHGLFFNSLYSCCSGKVQEYMILFLHWMPLNVLLLNSNLLLISSLIKMKCVKR